jgi:hypothetical protein
MPFGLLLASALLIQAAPAPTVYEGRPVAAWISDLGSKKYDVQDKAKKAIAAIGRPAVPGLVEALSSPRSELRSGAAWALGDIGDPAAVPALIALLSDREPDVAGAAATALGKLRDERAVEPLLAGLQAPGADKGFGGYARLRALARIGTETALVALERMATAGSPPSLRADAVKTIGETRDPRFVETLGSALNDADAGVRTAAADQLRFFDGPRVIEVLEAAAGKPATAEAAARVLRDVDTRGKPTSTVGDLQVTFMGIEMADTWSFGLTQLRAGKGNEFVIVRYRLKWLTAARGTPQAVEVYDSGGARLPTAWAAAGQFSFTSYGDRKAGEAVTSDAAFAAKKGTKLGKCTIHGAEFDLAASATPSP